MFPTLFAILLLVFFLVNIAPGSPGESLNVSGSENAQQSAEARESYRKFKEQYHLDKPILLNFRATIGLHDVAEELLFIARNISLTLPGEAAAHSVANQTGTVIEKIANQEYIQTESKLLEHPPDSPEYKKLQSTLMQMEHISVPQIRPPRVEQGRYQKAETRIENWGEDIVPFLMQLANSGTVVHHNDGFTVQVDTPGTNKGIISHVLTRKLRFLAVQRLSVNARRRIVVQPGESSTEAQQARNDRVLAHNEKISDWTYKLKASSERREQILDEWNRWFKQNKQRYQRNVGEEIERFFLDTRFAHYIGNLIPFELQPHPHVRPPRLGTSMRFRKPVTEVIGDHWQYSVFLSVASLLLAYLISVPIGVLAAVRQHGPIADRGVGIVLFVLYSLPNFFTATILQSYLTAARGVDIFPVTGFDSQQHMYMTTLDYWGDVAMHLVLPVFCLTYVSLAALSRYARTGLLEVIRSDYIRTARAKGLPEWIVVIKHAVRNGMIPIITLLGSTLPVLIGGSIIIEYIFGIKGMGALMLNSIHFRDYNVIMGILLLSSVLTLIGILLSDIAYSIVDPRIDLD